MSMSKAEYIDYIKLDLSGGVLELELTDDIISKYIDAALVEIRRYYDQSTFVTIPFARCIDVSETNLDLKKRVSSIVKIYRTRGFTGEAIGNTTSDVDPMYAQQWLAFSSGGMTYSLQNYLLNYMSYSTLQQIRNNTSTDLAFKEDKDGNKLYINGSYENPGFITVEYVPILTTVEEVNSDYWVDILKRLSLALVKRALGRIRTRFTQSNALWVQDGETLLQESNEEIKDLREILRLNSSMFYPID